MPLTRYRHRKEKKTTFMNESSVYLKWNSKRTELTQEVQRLQPAKLKQAVAMEICTVTENRSEDRQQVTNWLAEIRSCSYR